MTLKTFGEDGALLTALCFGDEVELREHLNTWQLPVSTAVLEIRREGELWLRVFPDGDTQPPHWDPVVADVLARVSAVAFFNSARVSGSATSWETMFPSDPLIAVAADVITTERLIVLRACVPESKALPGDWAPAALIRSVAYELTAKRLGEILHAVGTGDEHPLQQLLERLPPVEETLDRLSDLNWTIGERARLLMVARGWLTPLDAA
jgi:hypothetical protein